MHTVFAHGEPGPQRVDWLIVGEAPNDAEDASGVPFSGPEQALVEAMVQSLCAMPSAASRTAPNVVKVNALKCRPPAQRNPSAQELAQCRPYLWRQIALLQPRMVLAMGRLAAQALLADDLFESASQPLSTWRSKVHQVQGVPVVVTFHPSYLMRTPADKAKAWEDVCLALDHLANATP